MNNTKEVFILGFALFSLFFGAGNLLLPPLLGYNSGTTWGWVTIGFGITAVIIPILGIMAHAKLQGTMFDFGKKVSPTFSYIYCLLVYAISIAIPSPRTAAATHEIAIHPFFGTSPLITSCVYFLLVFIFVMNRSKIINLIGKYLTPLIVIILALVIGIGLISSNGNMNSESFKTPIITGLLEGYQTFDAIGAIVVGGVIIISLKIKGFSSIAEKRNLIKKAGLIAGGGLLFIYGGLIAVGAYFGSEIFVDTSLSNDMQRANLLRGISISTLGSIGASFLSILVALACFTTAIGIITGTSDYFKGLFNDSQKAYTITAILGCLFGILIGQLNFHSIVVIALPILMFIYPITIVLIILNVMPEKLASNRVFKAVVGITFLFSISDFLKFIINTESLKGIQRVIPFSEYSLGWVLPAILVFIFVNLFNHFSKKNLQF